MGDIAYADAWLKEEKGGYAAPLNTSDYGLEYEKILNDFYTQIQPLSAVKPYMVAVGTTLPNYIQILILILHPGNHEANCDNGADLTICPPGQLNFTGYRAHWKYVYLHIELKT